MVKGLCHCMTLNAACMCPVLSVLALIFESRAINSLMPLNGLAMKCNLLPSLKA